MTLMNPITERVQVSTSLKVTLSKADLLTLIGKIQGVIPSKPSLPILSYIVMEAKDHQLVLTASDALVSVKTYSAAHVSQEGKIAVPAKNFFSLVREITSLTLEIEVQGSMVYVKAGSSLFKLHGVPAEEFPSFPSYAENHFIPIHAPTLKELFTRTAFAVAKEDSRQALNGLCLQLTSQQLTLIGTDGKKLAKITADLDPQELQGQFIIPLKTVEEMIQALDDDTTSRLYLASDRVALETSSTLVISKLLVGEYPDIYRVIPQKTSVNLHLHREELISLLRQISLFISELNQSVRFIFRTGELELASTRGEVGEGKVSMPVDYEGEPLEIALNPFFFIEILKRCQDTTVHFGMINSFNPGVITDQTTALFVIMPMRLSSAACS